MTNKTPVGTYRGPGRFEGSFYMERLLDMVAADLGIDRVELRRRNLIGKAEHPYKLATAQPTNAHDQTDSGDYEATLDRCLKEFNYADVSKLGGKLIDGKYHGIGVSCFIEGGAAGPEGKRAARGQRRRHHNGLHGHGVGRAGRRDDLRPDRRRRT